MLPSLSVPRIRENVLFGRYELLCELGRGGMAELHVARLQGAGGFTKAVAIKRILPEISNDARFVELFLNEGRIASRMSHPNVCQVFELGEVDGRYFLAMEYLEGASWEHLVLLLPDDPVAALRLAAGAIAQACDGLGYAHELRDMAGNSTPVIHRDVSPQNLFVTIDGVAKVLDFGVSKMTSEGRRTHSGVVKGKLCYMPPEQISGQPVDARADVFAVGIMLWEALVGERLFDRATDFEVWQAVIEAPVPRLAEKVPEYGAAIDRLVAIALDRDREQRQPTIRDLAESLRQACDPFGGVATQAELAGFVRSRCAEELAARSRAIATAIVINDQPPVVVELAPPSATQSMELRDHSVAVVAKLSESRWPRRVVIVAGALAALLIAIELVIPRLSGTAARPQARSGLVDDASAQLAMAAPPDAALATIAMVTLDAGVRAGPKQPPPAHHAHLDHAHAAVATSVTAVAPIDTEPGSFSIDSDPYAVIYVDGRRQPGADQTPLFRVTLPPGRHSIRAVLADKRQKTFEIEIEPGRELNWHRLTW